MGFSLKRPNSDFDAVYLSKEKRELPLSTPKVSAQKTDVSLKKASKQESSSTLDPSFKNSYLGIRSPPREIKRNTKKLKFEWDSIEDTSRDNFYSSITNSSKPRQSHKAVPDELDLMQPLIHWSKKPLKEMRERDWRIFREEFSISIKGGAAPAPIRSWEEYEAISDDLYDVIVKKNNFKIPTPVQRQAIPIGLAEKDMVGLAETGSGKTAAFIIPILIQLQRLPRLDYEKMADGPYCLILAPTRELAQQIETEARKLCMPFGVRSLSIVGGHSMSEQSFAMRDGIEIVIGTPGRLRDCLEQRILCLNRCKFIVMDEADRMVDLGFEEDMRFIMDEIQASFGPNFSPEISNNFRQITMFSATMPLHLEKLAQKYLYKPLTVIIGNPGVAVDRINQSLELVHENNKLKRMVAILESGKFGFPIIVFANQKKTVDVIFKALSNSGFNAITLHGGKSQDTREQAISQLKEGKKDVLVATDVAGRGIDISNVGLVLNFDMARSIEDYIHRIGRTGRAGKDGYAITFLTAGDSDLFYDLRKTLSKNPNHYMPSEFLRNPASSTKPGSIEVKKRHEQVVFTA